MIDADELPDHCEAVVPDWIPRKGTQDEPMCINCFCPSFHDCALGFCEPVTDPAAQATIFVDPEPEGERCDLFEPLPAQPKEINP